MVFFFLVRPGKEVDVSKDRKIAVTLNLDRRTWWCFQELCRGNAVSFSQAVDSALIAVLTRAGLWPPRVKE